jgi:hypothetical protein
VSWEEEDGDGNLGSTLVQLRDDVDDLAAAIGDLPGRLSGYDSTLDDVRQVLGRLEKHSGEVESATTGLVSALKRLTARVEWLERNIRLQAETTEAALDDFDATDEQLATVAERGHQARAELLPPSGRSSLEAAVTAHAAAVTAETRERQLAMSACQVLADTRWDDERHTSAIAEFRSAVAGIDVARARVRELAPPALQAVTALGADEDRHLAVADVVAEGELAWDTLQARLRSRVAEAVGAGALLPAWFTSVLGPIPPAQDTRPWMDVATSLLAYRLTYAVSDPILALGREPGPESTARRRAWHLQLRRQVRDLQS